jgi:anti-sigma factor RsiW
MNDHSTPSILSSEGVSGGQSTTDRSHLSISCARVIATLGEFTDKSLSSLDQSRVELHLSSCPSCARDAEEYLEVIRLAGQLARIDPPAGVEVRLRALISKAVSRSAPIDNSMDETIP